MMQSKNWRELNQSTFRCEKQPAVGSGGIVAANHPLGAAAGAEMLAAGGNAVDAAVATLLSLTVVEPMMVGLLGGGMMQVRMSDGRHVVIDGQSQAPAAATQDMFETISDEIATRLETVGRKNACGPMATATAGNLPAWIRALETLGTFSLADVIAPAIRHAESGFLVTPYLSECIAEAASDMEKDAAIASIFLPNGGPIKPGSRLKQPAYAETLKTIARQGPSVLHGGAIGQVVAEYIDRNGGVLSLEDLGAYQAIEREPVRGMFRDFEIFGPPPPSSGGIHVIEMLNILEGFDLAGMGFGSVKSVHLLAEVMKIAFSDRDASTGDPAFLDVPVEQLIAKSYAATRLAQIDLGQAKSWRAGTASIAGNGENAAHTTHVTTSDRNGNVVVATHTINSVFGARYLIGETGLIPNNYMYLFDPHPGRALSIAPGKRVPTSMSPIIAIKDDKVDFAIGLTGGVRIFPSAMQVIINLVEHGMTLQEAFEAPRVWTQGGVLELEDGLDDAIAGKLANLGHQTTKTPHLGGGINGIRRLDDGCWEGAACWRADGTVIAAGGGFAREGVRFWPEQRR